MIRLVCSGLAWLSLILSLQLFAITSPQHRADTISKVGDSGPKVIDVDVWWEFQRILQNALIDTQISINIKAKRAADWVYFFTVYAAITGLNFYLLPLPFSVDFAGYGRVDRREK